VIPADILKPPTPASDVLRALEPRLHELGRVELAGVLAPLVARLEGPLSAYETGDLVDAALSICRRLVAGGRSAEGLKLARAALASAAAGDDSALVRRAANACGALCADSGDFASAIEYHVHTLRMAAEAGDSLDVCRAWGNIGHAMGVSGNHEMAVRCQRRAIATLEHHEDPVYYRFASHCNLADSLFQIGEFEEGLRSGQRALAELTPAFREQDLYSAALLQRNLVRLLLALGRVSEAEVHVNEAVALAERAKTPRAQIAAATTRAAYELATGRSDVALTRLDSALARAREVPATLRDMLACVIRAEESAGNVERALMRLEELSQHIYKFAIERARQHVELADLRAPSLAGADQRQAQAKARLVSRVAPPEAPDGWKTLQRLGVSAAMRMDQSGWHGVRVGALCKALALANGLSPLQALDMGLAAELHDIGMLSVPERILAKRGALNDAERAIVQRHVEAGAEILRDDRHPRILLAREIARYHHAHWDGNGYPERVSGERIPLGARICAVADAYDMMVCGFGGRAPKTMHQALAELGRQSGRQFDPELVRVFDDLIRAETADRGMDLASSGGMESFQELVLSLQEDRGFV
jgi:response regulator RpfG family c-di-GMP phosphodiesterase